ncbi:MAG: YadA-like family protein, partial [Neisseriaceae bacterium]|nr:YadA-like family protein [Neisseriaceae bacterium]
SGGTVDLSDYATKTYAESQANAAQTNANAYTDSKLGGLAKQADLTAVQGEVGSLKTDLGNKADKTALDGKADKSWVTTELAKVSSGEAIDLSDYAQKDYADNAANTAETNAKGYTDSEMAKAKSYADTAASQAKTDAVADANAYTDTQLGDYAKTTDMTAAINTAKTDAVANANAYTDTALSDNATQTWVNNQKFAKEQAVTDLNSRVDKLVVAGGGYEHITVAGENGSFNVANKETAKFVGDGKNITTDATGGEVKISLADDIAVNSVKVGNNGVALTPNGLNNGGQVISNVAAGVRPTDAVNVGQLHNAMGAAYARMDSMEKHANAGIAQAMASGNMPTIAKPGKGMLAVSGSAYRGESGYAIGYSQMSESGKWLFKATGSGNSRGHYGISAGVGLELW